MKRSKKTLRFPISSADKTASTKVKAALEEKKLTGVYYVDNTKRVYPYGNVGVQILGYVGSDGKGISGLEYYYDKELSGEDGSMIMETGLGGTPIAGGASQVTEAKNGKDIVLSLDINLQDEAEKQLTQAVKDNDAKDGGSLLAMNPKNGEIYAACSYPLPDFSGKTDLDPDSLNLKLVSNSYEPGSVFKVVTTAIGMENTLFGPDSTFNVPLTIDVGGHIVEDDDWRGGAMDMTVTEMMRRSSNVGMATLETQVIGDKRFAQGLEDLGIGQATGIDFPGEADGIVKPIDKYESYTGGNMSFGQGLAIPFIQVTRVYAAVANGGNLVTPHFATSIGGKDIDWPVKEGVLSKTTCDGEKEMLRTVIREGTGVRAQVSGYDIAGKTGTGQQVDKKTSAYDNSGHYVSSLCGFANADENIAFINAGYLFQNHPDRQAVADKLDAELKPIADKLAESKKSIDAKMADARKKIDAKIESLQKEASRLRQADIQKRQDEIAKLGANEEAQINKLVQEHEQKVQEFQVQSDKRQNEERAKLLESIQTATKVQIIHCFLYIIM